jgi:hypothetical protein
MALAQPASFRMSSWCEIGNFRPRSGTARGLSQVEDPNEGHGPPPPEPSLFRLVLDLRHADTALHG